MNPTVKLFAWIEQLKQEIDRLKKEKEQNKKTQEEREKEKEKIDKKLKLDFEIAHEYYVAGWEAELKMFVKRKYKKLDGKNFESEDLVKVLKYLNGDEMDLDKFTKELDKIIDVNQKPPPLF